MTGPEDLPPEPGEHDWSGADWTDPGSYDAGSYEPGSFDPASYDGGAAEADPPQPYGPGDADPAAGPADEPRGLPDEPAADWTVDPDGLDPSGADGLAGPADAADPAADLGGPAGGSDDDLGGPADGTDLAGAGDLDGTDPAGWVTAGESFPPAIEVDVAPADGGPWVDPELLGADDPAPFGVPLPGDPEPALLADLAAADGDPEAGWAAVRGSDDPAVRALAAHWRD